MITNREIEAEISRKAVVRTVLIRRPYAVVEIEYNYDGLQFDGVGFAKVCWPDEWDETEGIKIAVGRAVRDLRKQNKDLLVEIVKKRKHKEQDYVKSIKDLLEAFLFDAVVIQEHERDEQPLADDDDEDFPFFFHSNEHS